MGRQYQAASDVTGKPGPLPIRDISTGALFGGSMMFHMFGSDGPWEARHFFTGRKILVTLAN